MPEAGLIAAALLGLLGGTHCVGMCGGIVAALGTPQPGRQRATWPILLGYNLGRISGYALAGAAMGAIGSAGLLLNEVLPVQLGLYVLANLMLILLGLYLAGFTAGLQPLERFGARVWRRLQPLSRPYLPPRNWRGALPLGLIWGFLPCGLVYSVLSTAILSGSALRGATLMLAFGLGTLPNLLLAGMLYKQLRSITQHRWLRFAAGLLVVGFGILGLWRAPQLGGALWNGIVCHIA